MNVRQKKMRYNLLDLSIGIVLGAIGAPFGIFLVRRTDIPIYVAIIPFVVISYLVFSPPLYRLLRLRALWLPQCPHCHDKNRYYRFPIPQFRWPRDVIECAICKTTLELWYTKPNDSQLSNSMPVYLLVWPQSWGRWKPIQKLPTTKTLLH